MRNWLYCLPIFLLMACNQGEKRSMLGTKEIALSMPRVEIKDRILEEAQWIKANSAMKGSKIYYTMDGSIPDEGSEPFKDSILVENPGALSLRAFHEDFLPSETIRIDFIEKGIDVKEVFWMTALNEKYGGNGPNTLTDHKKGTNDFASSKWLGFDSISRVKIELLEEIEIDRLELGYLVQTGSWIFPPKAVKLYILEDADPANDVEGGRKLIGEFRTQPLLAHASSLESLQMVVGKRARQLELEFFNQDNLPSWHDGSGKSGWLFMDEIIIYEKK